MHHCPDLPVRGSAARARGLGAALLVSMAIGCAGSTHQQLAVADDIACAWREHIAAAKRKDLAGVMAIWADDPVYALPGVDPARGRDEVARREAEALAGAEVLDARHTLVELRVLGDCAWELGTVEGPLQPPGQAARVITFHFAALWQRDRGGIWRMRVLTGLAEGAAAEPVTGPATRRGG